MKYFYVRVKHPECTYVLIPLWPYKESLTLCQHERDGSICVNMKSQHRCSLFSHWHNIHGWWLWLTRKKTQTCQRCYFLSARTGTTGSLSFLDLDTQSVWERQLINWVWGIMITTLKLRVWSDWTATMWKCAMSARENALKTPENSETSHSGYSEVKTKANPTINQWTCYWFLQKCLERCPYGWLDNKFWTYGAFIVALLETAIVSEICRDFAFKRKLAYFSKLWLCTSLIPSKGLLISVAMTHIL